MRILEQIKEERAKLKGKPTKERWEYFWDYYKWPVLVGLFVLVLLVQGIVSAINQKDIAFSGILLNCKITIQDEAFLQDFYDRAGIDGDTQEAAFYTDITLTGENSKNDITAFQRIMAGVATKDTDFLVGKPDAFQICAYSTGRIFIDLREFLDKDTLDKFADRLYYIDGAVLDLLDAPVGEQVSITEYPDPTKPETMKDPIPVGIDVSDCKALTDAYYFPNTTLYISVIANTLRPELTRTFIDYLFS